MSIGGSKAIEIVVGIVIGCISFFAGQVWSLGKTFWRERKLKRALRLEIQESRPRLLRNLKTFECMIQLSCLQELANRGPVPIPVQIHAEHFPEINLSLSTAERQSVNAIYNLFHGINGDCEKIIELNPNCGNDADNLQRLRLILDRGYRNSHHVLLLIQLYLENIDKLHLIGATDEADELFYELESRNDADLLRLAAEAKSQGSAQIRQKYRDGAVSASEIAPSPRPIPGHFYFDSTGAKYKCLSVQNDAVTWMQLASRVGALTVDALVRQPLGSVRHSYEITDPDEVARLERRCAQLSAHMNSRRPR